MTCDVILGQSNSLSTEAKVDVELNEQQSCTVSNSKTSLHEAVL